MNILRNFCKICPRSTLLLLLPHSVQQFDHDSFAHFIFVANYSTSLHRDRYPNTICSSPRPMRPRTNIRTLRDVNTPLRPSRLNQAQFQSPFQPQNESQEPQDINATTNSPQHVVPQSEEIVIPTISSAPNRSLSHPLSPSDRLNVTMSVHNQTLERITQPQSGEGFVIDHLVTVYGFDNLNSILPLFSSISPILNRTQSNSQGSVILEYSSPVFAREALKLHGDMLNQHIIGVKCTEVHEIPPHYISDLIARFGDTVLSPMETSQANLTMGSLLNSSIISTSNLGGHNNPLSLDNEVTMAIQSPDIRKRVNRQEFVCVSPYSIDKVSHNAQNSLNSTQTQNRTQIGMNKIKSTKTQRQQGHTRGIATYDEYLRNRGCLSRCFTWFGMD